MSKPLVREYEGFYFFKILATVVPTVRKMTVSLYKKREMYFHDKLMSINCIFKIPPYGRKENTCTIISEVGGILSFLEYDTVKLAGNYCLPFYQSTRHYVS
jgi:hypothetical protein